VIRLWLARLVRCSTELKSAFRCCMAQVIVLHRVGLYLTVIPVQCLCSVMFNLVTQLEGTQRTLVLPISSRRAFSTCVDCWGSHLQTSPALLLVLPSSPFASVSPSASISSAFGQGP
jgi:hypothetical protein